MNILTLSLLSVIHVIFFLALGVHSSPYSDKEDNFLCEFISASNVNSKAASWVCVDVADKCNWLGITCESTFITNIDLDALSITGTLPSSIGLLTKLTYLKLRKNRISGTLPSTIGNLAKLEHFQIQENSFSQSFPDVFSSLTSLRKIYIQKNQFNGSLPESLGNLNLEFIGFHSNLFTGTLPSYIGGMSALTGLSINDNQFTGPLPSELVGLTHLSSITIHRNLFNGSIPNIFVHMSKMTELSLHDNFFSDDLPSSIGMLSSLVDLQAQSNSITGVPSSVSALSTLTLLRLDENPLSGSAVLDNILSITSLEHLELSDATLGPTLPSSVGNLSRLVHLEMGSCGFNTPLPHELTQLSILSTLDFSGNDFTGAVPAGLWQLDNLVHLSLNWNEVEGTIPTSVGSLGKLTELALSGNSFHGILPTEMGDLSNLHVLHIEQNSFTGPIPSFFGQYAKLSQLEMNENVFSGSIPSSMGTLSNLVTVMMYSNSLTGSVPSGFGEMSKLRFLHLQGNNLNGIFPSEICNLGSLSEFFLVDSTSNMCNLPPTAIPTSIPSHRPSSDPTGQPTNVPTGSPTTSMPTDVPSYVPTGSPTTSKPTGQPSCVPTGSPTTSIPTGQPSSVPTGSPTTSKPTGLPSSVPTGSPTTSIPTGQPTNVPTGSPTTSKPTGQPSSVPTGSPTTSKPTGQPSSVPTGYPTTSIPTGQPTTVPTGSPTTSKPTGQPSSVPTGSPTTSIPTGQPTNVPTGSPTTSKPTGQPSSVPTGSPTTSIPTGQPTNVPTGYPTTSIPTGQPTTVPTGSPTTSKPTGQPSSVPTGSPTTSKPTGQPSSDPTGSPTTSKPTGQPSSVPTGSPTTSEPTGQPSSVPTGSPTTSEPTGQPSSVPTGSPTTSIPTGQPTNVPTGYPTTSIPTGQPSSVPTGSPTTSKPTGQPSSVPTGSPTTSIPTGQPTNVPTGYPTTSIPTGQPSYVPTGYPTTSKPTDGPSYIPTGSPTTSKPTGQPSSVPTESPTTSMPTGVPSCVPTGSPTTSKPTGQPTNVPTGFPTTSIPTGQPSSVPTGSPTTSMPTDGPSYVPTGYPTTSKPTDGPSYIPTGSPTTSKPTGQPSSVPTESPTTLMPTGVPSYVPTGSPTTSKPTGQPTNVPTGFPTTSIPTGQPSSVPTGSPTTSMPTGVPSCVPTGSPTTSKPTGQPTNVPTGSPTTSIPTGQPSSVPTGSPTTSMPTGVPSCVPTGYPTTSMPTVQPTNVPTGSPTTSIPTGQPSSVPTGSPTTSMPTGVPSCVPTGYPTTSMPTVQPTNVPTGSPTTSIPTGQPTKVPTGSPTTLMPTDGPSYVPTRTPTTSKPTDGPSYIPTGSPTTPDRTNSSTPDITNIDIITSKNYFVISASVSMPGTLYCGAFLTTTPPISILTVTMTNNFAIVKFPEALVHITIDNLLPNTAYNVYCVASSVYGTSTSLADMVTNKMLVRTECCKEISISLAGVSYAADTDVPSFLAVAATAAPSFPLTVTFTARLLDGSNRSTNIFVPSTVEINSKSWTATKYISLIGSPAGRYDISVSMSGVDGGNYSVIFSEQSEFTLQLSGVEPPVPSLTAATFTSDGMFVIVKFDSPTDMAGQFSLFPCSLVFSFEDDTNSTCEWTSPYSVLVTPGATSNIDVGEKVAVVENVLRASCPFSSFECLQWKTVPSTSAVIISAPVTPTPPEVVISGPDKCGPCDEVVLDLLSSTGSGRKAWKNVTVDVMSRNMESARQLEIFFSTYEVGRPTTIPRDLLNPGYYYDFHFTLCNFLNSCSHSVHRLVMTYSSVPLVRILGRKSRSIATAVPLVLQADASVSYCNGTKSYAGLEYSWYVTRDGSLDSSVASTSRDMSKFRVQPFTLSPGSVYEFAVQVIHTDSHEMVMSSVYVAVTRSDLVASIYGGTHRTVRLGESIVIDASGSYDADAANFTDTYLSYSWSCYQYKPRLSAECGLNISFDGSVATTYTSLTTSTSTVFVITVIVSDFTRESEQSVYITVSEAIDPVGIVSAKHMTTVFNSADDITLLASVNLAVPAIVEWVVNDASVNLTPVSRTEVSKYFVQGQHIFNIVVMGNALVGRFAPYVFSLYSNNQTLVSIAVKVNSAPSAGTFDVEPTNGTATNTNFLFVAKLWMDDDSPVSFQFGYLSYHDTFNVVRDRSESGYGYSILPAGRTTKRFLLTCLVVVFDVFDARASASTDVFVQDIELDSLTLQDKITAELRVSWGNLDSTKMILSTTSSILNTRDCSNAPDCAALNREECARVDNTCGKCLPGFIGPASEDNSDCINVEVFTSIFSNDGYATACRTDYDCALWTYCSVERGVCERSMKNCLQNCSGNGKCGFRNVDTGASIDVCFMGDTTCEAICSCNEGFGGTGCRLTATELQVKQSIQRQLLEYLRLLCKFDDPSSNSISTWQLLLASITESGDKLSPTASKIALDIADYILWSASDIDISNDCLRGVLNSVDSIIIASAPTSNYTLDQHLSSLGDPISMLDSIGLRFNSDMVEGQRAIESVNKMFRLTTQVLPYSAGNSTVLLPMTSTEQSTGIQPNSLFISANSQSEQRILAASLKARLYSNSTNFNSDALRVVFDSSFSDNSSVTLVVRNYVEDSYGSLNDAVFVNTTCSEGDYAEYEHICPGGDMGDMSVLHVCNGSAVMMETRCPTVAAVPVCRVLNGDNFNCTVQSYSTASTVCMCYHVINDSKRRSLSLEGTGALEVAAVTQLVVEDFATTISTAGDFDSSADLEDTIIVIMLYGVMWVGGLIGIAMCSIRQYVTHRKVGEGESRLEKKKMLASTTKSAADVRNYLTAYVNEIFPSVFHAKSVSRRLWDEICKHHRYLVLFTASGVDGDNLRILTGLHLLTIQSMLMFILAVCYDLQFPQDDGSCEAFTTESECLRQKSPFDVDVSLCSWNEDSTAVGGYSCAYEPPTMTVRVIIIISIVVATITAPVNLLVDFLFIEILSAPTADSLKVRNRESLVKRVARRSSAVGRRVSSVSTQALKSLRNSVLRKPRYSFGLTGNVPTTRMVPESAEEAHHIASTSVREILQDVKAKIDTRVTTRDVRRKESDTFKSKKNLHEKRKYRQRSDSDVVNFQHDVSDDTIDNIFFDLSVDITEQRRNLKNNQKEVFDTMWGIDPTGEFSKQTERTLFCTLRTMSAESAIKKELMFVKAETQSKYEKLRFATDVQIGMEILHLFIVDLLGRDTPVAKIFLTKSEEDFRHSYVVTKMVKTIAWAVVVLLNLFFVYFSLLRGLERGFEWQRLFLVACIIQFIVEILFYETSECAIVHFYIPDLARNEVRSVGFAVHQAVSKVCTATVESASNVILDAPRYLFVSTNVAKKFPDLLESIIVMSYHTYSPGEFSKKWRFFHFSESFVASVNPWARSRSRVKRFTLSTMCVGLLQQLGAMSPTFQRVVIHTLQPLVVSAICLLFVLVEKHPIFLVLFVPPLLYKLYCGIRDYECDKTDSSRSSVDDKGADMEENLHNNVNESINECLPKDRGVCNEETLRLAEYPALLRNSSETVHGIVADTNEFEAGLDSSMNSDEHCASNFPSDVSCWSVSSMSKSLHGFEISSDDASQNILESESSESFSETESKGYRSLSLDIDRPQTSDIESGPKSRPHAMSMGDIDLLDYDEEYFVSGDACVCSEEENKLYDEFHFAESCDAACKNNIVLGDDSSNAVSDDIRLQSEA